MILAANKRKTIAFAGISPDTTLPARISTAKAPARKSTCSTAGAATAYLLLQKTVKFKDNLLNLFLVLIPAPGYFVR
jgi:hypothetical protein